MKKSILTLVAILIASLSFAQGGGFNYKALITDNGNVLNTQPVTFKFTLLENGTTSVYQETQSATTDANGIVAVNVGEGTLVSGNFNTIDWGSNPYFLKVEIDTGSGYQDFGTTEFKAVPYAKFAEKAGNVFSGDFSALSNVPAGLSDGDDDTHLTESQVDSYVSNNGYLTQVDNIRGIPVSSTAPTNGQILKYNGTQFVPADDDTSGGSGTDGVVNSAAFSGTSTKTLTLGRSNGLTNVTANFTDNDTHLTDAQIGAMGYIKNANDADHDATNEIQNLTLSSTQLSISNGNNVNFTGWDTNAADDFDGDFTSLSNVPAGLSDGDDDTHLTDAQIGAMGYIKNPNDADHDATNEIQTLSVNSNQLSITNGNTVTLPAGVTKLDDLSDAKSDNDGTNNGSSVYIGVDAGANDDQTANRNVGVGFRAMNSNTTGFYNTASGYNALYSNISGYYNTADGYMALFSNTEGVYNTANGSEALYSNTIGSGNTADGYGALRSNTEGGSNTATGYYALRHNTTGGNNTASGRYALLSNTMGVYNTASGSSSLRSNTTGSYNIAIGGESLDKNSTGRNNIAIGYKTMYKNTTGEYNTANGNESLYSNTTGIKNTSNGNKSMNKNTTGSFNTANGHYALYNNTTGSANTANGSYALDSNTTGYSNVAIGTKALYSNTDKSNLVAVGDSALYNNGTGASGNLQAKYNTAIGSKALYSNTTGYNNTANGYRALYSNTTGYNNIANGYMVLNNNTTGNNNNANGNLSLYSNITGNKNTANGYWSLYANITGNYNTAIGFHSLSSVTDGQWNTALGYYAYSNGNYSNSTAIGNRSHPNGSNQVRLGNSSVTSIGGYANWTNVSDRRFKTNIQENVVGLDFITKLRPVTYHLDMDAIAKFNKTPDNFRLPDSEGLKAAEVQTGFIAQEVEQAAQSVGYNFHGVDTPDNEKDHYGLRYAEFVVPLTKAVQELNQKHDEEIEALKTTIQNQQNEIEALKKQNEEKQKQQEKELQELKKILLQLIKDK